MSQVVKSSPHAIWINEKVSSQLRTFSNEPIDVAVKKDQTIKLALDSKILNKTFYKNKYQILMSIRLSNLFLNKSVLLHRRTKHIFSHRISSTRVAN